MWPDTKCQGRRGADAVNLISYFTRCLATPHTLTPPPPPNHTPQTLITGPGTSGQSPNTAVSAGEKKGSKVFPWQRSSSHRYLPGSCPGNSLSQHLLLWLRAPAMPPSERVQGYWRPGAGKGLIISDHQNWSLIKSSVWAHIHACLLF